MPPRFQCFSVLALTLGLTAWLGCGGGGGSAPPPGPTLSISTTSISFTGDVSDVSAPAPRSVTGSISNANSTVYLFVSTSGHVLAGATVNFTGGTTGSLTLYPKQPSQLGPGSFTDTVNVSASMNASGSPQIAGSPVVIQVSYLITGLSALPSSVALTSVEGLASSPTPISLSNQSDYGTGPSGWLSLSASSGTGTSASISVTGAALSAGTYSATVNVTAGSKVVQVPVTYTVGANLGLGAQSAAFSAVSGQASMPAAIAVPVMAARPGTSTYSASIAYGNGASGWLNATGSQAPGSLSLVPNTTALTPGTAYQATVTLTPTGGGTAVQIPVSYTLTASALSVAPLSSGFSIDATTTPGSPALTRTVSTADSGASLAWTATSNVPWLAVTGSGISGGSATLTVLPAQLGSIPNGTWTATVTFAYSGSYGASGVQALTVPLLLHVPSVDQVMPYVAYQGEQREVVIRGGGFLQGTSSQILFDGLAPTSIEVRSDTEIRAIPPPTLAVGQVTVSTLPNALGLVRTKNLVVRSAPTYASTSVPSPTSSTYPASRVLYDAEREALLAVSPGYIGTSYVHRTAYSAATSTWTTTSTYFSGVFDIAFTPDGKSLLVLCESQLLFVDPVSLSTQNFVDFPSWVGGTGHQMVVTNNGQVLMPGNARKYSLMHKTLTAMNLPQTTAVADISGDGSMAVMGYYPDQPIVYYDAASDSVQWTSVTGYAFPCTLDRSATKVVMGNAVRDRSMAKVGQLSVTPTGFFGTTCLSPDGNRFYAADSQTNVIRVFDVSGSGPAYPELSPVPNSANGSTPHLLTSPDGKYLFSYGNSILVLPLP